MSERFGSAPRSKLVANCFLAIVSAAAAEMIAAGTGAAAWTGNRFFWALTRLAPVLKTRKAGFVGICTSRRCSRFATC